jgi:hypothetical protein
MGRKRSSPPLDESVGAASTASPSANDTPPDSRRRSPRSDTEKLEMACKYMRKELRWSISDLIKALASTHGANNARRKAAFAAAAYKDPEVVRCFFNDADELWNGVKESVIGKLDLGKNELRKEVKSLNSIEPFNKYDPTLKSRVLGEFGAFDIDQLLDTIQKEAPLLLQLIRDIMAPENQWNYQRNKELAGRIVTIISLLCFSQRQNTCTGFQTSLGVYYALKV